MPITRSMDIVARKSEISTYPQLLRRIREILAASQQRIEWERVQSYWEVGRLINEHLNAGLKLGQKHAGRGKHVVLKLAQDLKLSSDLEISVKVLYKCRQFARAFPYFSHGRNKLEVLTWSHYRILLAVPDERKRLELAERAARRGWASLELARVVRKIMEKERAFGAPLSAGEKPVPELLEPQKGLLYTYRMLAWRGLTGEEELKVDLGFRIRKKASFLKGAGGLSAGDIVEAVSSGNSYRLEKSAERTAADLFTYRASVLRVVDGDTLYVEIDLGFGITVEDYLRLRGIDAPELDAKGGREARDFVEKELRQAPWIVLTSSRSDKYDRYLADVFYEVGGQERYLNNRLLEEGLAWRV